MEHMNYLHRSEKMAPPTPQCAPIYVAPVTYAPVTYNAIEYHGEAHVNRSRHNSAELYRRYIQEISRAEHFRELQGAWGVSWLVAINPLVWIYILNMD